MKVVCTIALMMATVTCVSVCADSENAEPASQSSWQSEFDLAGRNLTPTGRNMYFILEPGFQLVLEGKRDKLVITVLDETREIDGVLTRVVEEREWRNGHIIEVSRNFFAICEETHDVFYFGEEVDMFKDGKVVSHTGAWLAGQNKSRPGLIMPGQPKVGIRYYQEVAPSVAMDRAEVIKVGYTLTTPAGSFSNCLVTRESTPLNLREREYKVYAPGIGLIRDENLLLTGHGFIKQN